MSDFLSNFTFQFPNVADVLPTGPEAPMNVSGAAQQSFGGFDPVGLNALLGGDGSVGQIGPSYAEQTGAPFMDRAAQMEGITGGQNPFQSPAVGGTYNFAVTSDESDPYARREAGGVGQIGGFNTTQPSAPQLAPQAVNMEPGIPGSISNPPTTVGGINQAANSVINYKPTPGMWDNIGAILKNNAGVLGLGGMLGMGAIKQLHPLPGVNQLKTAAGQLNAAAAPLMAPLTKGAALPGGTQSGIDQAAAAQAAQIRSQYANMGLSNSSMEQQALAAVEQQKQQAYASAAQTLYNQGLQTMGQATATDQAVTQAYAAQDSALTQMLGRVAAAFAPATLKELTGATGKDGTSTSDAVSNLFKFEA